MRVKNIRLINFRNYNSIKLELNDKLNIFLGNNAQGKTNLLESIYIASAGKSYKTNKDKELINLSKRQAYIGIEIETNRGDRFIEIKFDIDSPKRIKINRLELEKISELIGVFNVVIFSPEDLKLIKDGPSERRDFLDIEISQIKPKYRYSLAQYNKTLYQRNRLLKSAYYDKKLLDTIESWDLQLAKYGSDIIYQRQKFVEDISKVSGRIHKNISGNREELSVIYIPSFDIDDNLSEYSDSSLKGESLERTHYIEKEFIKKLKNSIDDDLERGRTYYGPHKDDIDILIDDKSCRIFGSQGQQRTSALSLRLAEVEIINKEVGEYPVILLDDVLSELDEIRRKKLISTFKEIQTIITSTDDIDIEEVNDNEKSVFYIKSGSIERNE